ncbi:MAG: hypothetical protein AAGC55_02775 [Myxococcota bacterium]
MAISGAHAEEPVPAAQIAAQVAAEMKKGEALWSKSCALRGAVDLCVQTRTRRDKTYCTGEYTQINVRRKAALATRATKHFTRVIELAQSMPDRAPQAAAVRSQAMAANLRLAEYKMEAVLAVRVPTGLAFDAKNARTRKRAEERFARWRTETQMSYVAARDALSPLTVDEAARVDAGLAALAAARLAQLNEHFASFLRRSWIPGDVRQGEWAEQNIKAYCSTTEKTAALLDQQAQAAYARCATLARDKQIASELPRKCADKAGAGAPSIRQPAN